MFTFVIFAILLVSCSHDKPSGTDQNSPLPANTALKGTKWATSDQQVIEFSNDTNLATLKSLAYPFGISLKATYEVEDEKKVIIKLDDFISKLENFGEKELVEVYKSVVIEATIISYQFAIDNTENPLPDAEKEKFRNNITKLKNGMASITDKASLKKFIIEIFFPMNIAEIEENLKDPQLPADAKAKMEQELQGMKGALADPSKIDAMLEKGIAEFKELANKELPGIKKSNPITLKCEDGETIKTTAKLISCTDFTIEKLEFMLPVKFGDGDEFVKQ